MADDVELTALARERILEKFQIDLQREALEMVVCRRDMFVIEPKGSGKSLIFQSVPIFFGIVLVISPVVSPMLGEVRFLKSLGISA